MRFESALACKIFLYDVAACVVARVWAIDRLHFGPAKVPIADRFRDPLVLNGRGAIPGGRQFGLAVGETRVYEEPVALGTGEASHGCHHLISETLQEVYLRRVAGRAVELAGSPGAAGVGFAWGQAFLNLPDVVGCVEQEDGGLDAVDYILREEARGGVEVIGAGGRKVWSHSLHGYNVAVVRSQAAAPGNINGVEEEACVGEALDGGASAGEEGAELVAVEYRRQPTGGAAREKRPVGRRHPDGEEVLDGFLPNPLPPEVEPGTLVEGVAGEGGAVAVADLHPVPVVEIRILGGAGAHDAGEGDLPLHEVGGAMVSPCPEPARPRVVAPPASLEVDDPALAPCPGARVQVVSGRRPIHTHGALLDGGVEEGDGHHHVRDRRRGTSMRPPPPATAVRRLLVRRLHAAAGDEEESKSEKRPRPDGTGPRLHHRFNGSSSGSKIEPIDRKIPGRRIFNERIARE